MTENSQRGFGRNRAGSGMLFSAAAVLSAAVFIACGSSSSGQEQTDGGSGGYVVLPDFPADGGDGGAQDTDAQLSFEDGGMDEDASPPFPEDAGLPPAPPPLSLSGVFPNRAPLGRSVPIVLSGLGFFRSFSASGGSYAASQTQIFIGDAEVKNFTITNDYSIDAAAPASAEVGTFDVLIRNPSGESVCTDCFTYYVPLSLNSSAPASGLVSGGEWVELSGAGFDENTRVYFGGRESPSTSIQEQGRLRALTPEAAAPGMVDIEVIGSGGAAWLRNAYEYLAAPALLDASPRVLPLTGGEISLSGTSLLSVESLALDGLPVDFSAVSDEKLTLTAPGRSSSGSADLSAVWTSGLTSTLPGGIFWSEDISQEEAVSLLAVVPSRGPSAGGMPVTLIGTGLKTVTAVTIGGTRIDEASFISKADTSIAISLPEGIAGEQADVAVFRGEESAAVLPGAFRYGPALLSIEPEKGTPGTDVRIIGEGFGGEDCGWIARFGVAEAAETTRISQTELSTRVPAGRGVADLKVYPACAPEAAAVLTGAFTYEAPLKIFSVSPGSGSVAGGEYVTVYGSGFAPGISFRIGSSLLKDVSVSDTSHASGRVPAGTAGIASVYASLGDQSAELSGGYVYRAPPSATGGSTGQAISGALSVITSTSSGTALPGVSVAVSLGGEVIARGVTDSNGMLTLQSPAMNRPVQVVFRKAGFRSLTVVGQASDTISVLLQQVQAASSEPGGAAVTSGGVLITGGTIEENTSQIPSNSTAGGGGTSSPTFSVGSGLAVISGTVSGFKLPRELAPGEIPMAKVSVAPASYLSTAPFSSSASEATRDALGERWRVTSDGGPFTIYGRDGQQTVYAIFGIYNTLTGAFEPSLMGLAKNVSSLPSSPAAGIDIILDIHLTSMLSVSIGGAELGPDGTPLAEEERPNLDAYAWLSLGSGGYIPFTPAEGGGPLVIHRLPELSAENFLFLGRMVTQRSGTGLCFQRSEGALSDGVFVGPMVAASRAAVPSEVGASIVDDPDTGGAYAVYPFDGVLRWELESGTPGDMQRIFVQVIHADGTEESAEAILPGSATALDLSALLDAPVDPARDNVSVSYTSVRSPRFDYDFWSYSYFNTSALSCWTQGTFEPVLRKFIPAEDPPSENGE